MMTEYILPCHTYTGCDVPLLWLDLLWGVPGHGFLCEYGKVTSHSLPCLSQSPPFPSLHSPASHPRNCCAPSSLLWVSVPISERTFCLWFWGDWLISLSMIVSSSSIHLPSNTVISFFKAA
ncbi:hypothetical protein H1C71_042277 [Ictidomys tridecemlineatus]|nr:hypothetical protein H1C71_042277 [Ictidomys tridecemlineatus]